MKLLIAEVPTIGCGIVGTLFMQQRSPLPLRNVERWKINVLQKIMLTITPNIAWREGEGMK